MASQKDKLQMFNEKLDNLKSTLYLLGIESIDNLNLTSPKTEQEKSNGKENNLKKEV